MPSFLRRNRHGGYHFRRVIPLAVRHAFDGKHEVVLSLRTHCRRDAVVLAQALNLEVEGIIRMAKGQPMPSARSYIGWTRTTRMDPDGSVTEKTEVTPEDIDAYFRAGLSAEQIVSILAPSSPPQAAPQASPGIPRHPPSQPFRRLHKRSGDETRKRMGAP